MIKPMGATMQDWGTMVRMDEDEVIGLTSHRACALAGISMHQLASWERIGLVHPGVSVKLNGRRVRVYGLEQLVELRVVKELADRSIEIIAIRAIAEAHRSAVEHPLRELRWGVVPKDKGRPDVYVGYPDGGWVGGRVPMQGVMIEVLNLEEIRTALRQEIRQRPVDLVGRTERRRATMGNKLLFAGTRTPVEAVQSYLRRGLPESEILEAFPHLSQDDIDVARSMLVSVG